jgi:hypothetical protein
VNKMFQWVSIILYDDTIVRYSENPLCIIVPVTHTLQFARGR